MVNGNSPADGGEATLPVAGYFSGGLGRVATSPNPILRSTAPATRWPARSRSRRPGSTSPSSISTNQHRPADEDQGPALHDHPCRGREARGRPGSSWAASMEQPGVQPGRRRKPVPNTDADAPGQEAGREGSGTECRAVFLEALPGRPPRRGSATGGLRPRRPERSPSEWTSYIEAEAFNGFTGLGTSKAPSKPSIRSSLLTGRRRRVTTPAAIEGRGLPPRSSRGRHGARHVSFRAARSGHRVPRAQRHGKSTLLRAILGIDHLTSGRAPDRGSGPSAITRNRCGSPERC